VSNDYTGYVLLVYRSRVGSNGANPGSIVTSANACVRKKWCGFKRQVGFFPNPAGIDWQVLG